MAWIKTAGGSYTSTKTGEVWVKSPGKSWINTKTGGQLIKTPGGTWTPIGTDDTNIPTFLMEDEDF